MNAGVYATDRECRGLLLVSVSQTERANRRAGILQTVTINTVAAAALLNIGVTLNGQGAGGPSTASFLAAGEDAPLSISCRYLLLRGIAIKCRDAVSDVFLICDCCWVAGLLAVFTVLGMKRVERLDKFEKML